MLRVEPEWKLFTSKEEDKLPNSIDVIVIDFHQEKNNKLLKMLIEVNPEQKIVILSDKESCHRDCDFCISKYRRRLFKPIDAKDLHHTIKNFDSLDCRYNEKFDNIKTILPDIMRRFTYYKYDDATNTFSTYDGVSSGYVKELNEIINILNVHEVKYSIKEDGCTIILK